MKAGDDSGRGFINQTASQPRAGTQLARGCFSLVTNLRSPR